jgi:3-dehydroquinate synthase
MDNPLLLITLGLFQKMPSINIKSKFENYSIHIQSGIFYDLLLKNEFVLLDSVFRERFSVGEAKVIWVDAKEGEKNLQTCEQVLIQMKNLGMTRQSHLLAVGGGFVQDIATLTTSLFMRGIKWSYVPTTLMSMLDSCVGGKSSINVDGAKNLIGNIYPPNGIYVDSNFTSNLSKMAIASGLCEAIKICFAAGPVYYEKFIELQKKCLQFDSLEGEKLVEHVLICKKIFVEIDEFDQRERQLLNFGHTFGHALESAMGFEIAHGVAIGVGIIAALELQEGDLNQIQTSLRSSVLKILEPVLLDITKLCKQFNPQLFLEAFKKDKKHTPTLFRLILCDNDGLKIVEIGRTAENLENVLRAMTTALDKCSNL